MFERFTEAARHTIFLAKEEAERLGSEQIKTEHLLLGTFAQEALINHLLGSGLPKEVRSEIAQGAPKEKKDSSDIDASLNEESKATLNLGVAEADRLQDKQVGNEHLILGMMIHSKCRAARLLVKHGLSLETLRERIARLRSDPDLATKISRSPSRRIDWSEFGIPEGYAYPRLLYNAASEMMIIQVEGTDELRPKRLYMKHKDAPKYEQVGSPEDMTSYEDPVVSISHPLLAFNVQTWQKLEQGVGGDWKELQVLDLEIRTCVHSVKKGELILPPGFSDGWISDLIALSDDGARAYIKVALRRTGKSGPVSRVYYFVALLDLTSKQVETLAELRGVFF